MTSRLNLNASSKGFISIQNFNMIFVTIFNDQRQIYFNLLNKIGVKCAGKVTEIKYNICIYILSNLSTSSQNKYS